MPSVREIIEQRNRDKEKSEKKSVRDIILERNAVGKNIKKSVSDIIQERNAGTSINKQIVDPKRLAEIERLANEESVALEEQRTSVLERVFNVLRVGEFAAGSAIAKARGIELEEGQKISPSEALGITDEDTKLFSGEGLLGLAADIFLDPVTYITFGFGTSTKVGTQILSKKGLKVYKTFVDEVGEDVAKREMAKRLASDTTAELVDKGGLKFMGKQVVSREKTLAPFKATKSTLEKAPVVGKRFKSAEEALAKAFKPFHEIKDILKEKGEDYVTAFGKVSKSTRFDIDMALRPYRTMGKNAKRILGKDAGKVLSYMVENGSNFAAMPDDIFEGVAKIKSDKVAMDTIDNIAAFMVKRNNEIAKAEKGRGLLSTEMPNYMRHFLTKEGREFTKSGGADPFAVLSKPLRVKLGSSNPRNFMGTIKEINDELREKVGANFFEEDAFKIMAGREAESLKAVRMFDFFQDVGTKFGRPLEKVGEEGVPRVVIHDGIGYVQVDGVPQLKNMLVPEPIAKHVNQIADVIANDDATREFLGAYDKILSFWKGSVTGYFPTFHTRNFVGGVFNNWLAGVKDPTLYAKAAGITGGKSGFFKVGNRAYSYAELKTMAGKLGVTGQPGYLDVMRNVEDEIQKSAIKKIAHFPTVAMEKTEDMIRLPLFMDGLRKGLQPEEAAKRVFKFQFDYAPEGLTTFERNVMKRLIPFYRWSRGNIPLQLEQIVRQPGKFAGLSKVIDNITGKDGLKEKENLPLYMREQLPVRLSPDAGKDGASLWLSSIGLPLEDVNNIWAGDMQRTWERFIGEYISPAIKAPFEFATGRNVFFGEDIDEMTWVYPYVAENPVLRTWLDVRERRKRDGGIEYHTTQPNRLWALNTAAGRFYSTAGRVSQAPTWGQVVSRLFSPANIKDIDPQWEATKRERERIQRIEEELKKKGRRSEFNIWYTTKD